MSIDSVFGGSTLFVSFRPRADQRSIRRIPETRELRHLRVRQSWASARLRPTPVDSASDLGLYATRTRRASVDCFLPDRQRIPERPPDLSARPPSRGRQHSFLMAGL